MPAPIPPLVDRRVQIATTELLDRAIQTLKTSAGDPAVPFSSIMESTFAIGGHSQGSIPVFASLAPDSPGRNAGMPPGYVPDPAIRAAFMFGGALLSDVFTPGERTLVLPDQPPLVVTNDIPLFMIGGAFDGLGTSNPEGQRKTMRRLAGISSKRLWIIPGGNHFGFADGPRPGDGTAPQDLPPTISVKEQNDLAVQAVVAFFDCTLKGIEDQCENLARSFASDWLEASGSQEARCDTNWPDGIRITQQPSERSL